MKRSLITALIVANVALAGSLAWRATSASADAQAAPGIGRGKYVLVPGYSRSLNASIIYVFDYANRRLGAIAPDQRENFSTMRPILLDPIFESAATSGVANDPVRARPGRGQSR